MTTLQPKLTVYDKKDGTGGEYAMECRLQEELLTEPHVFQPRCVEHRVLYTVTIIDVLFKNSEREYRRRGVEEVVGWDEDGVEHGLL